MVRKERLGVRSGSKLSACDRNARAATRIGSDGQFSGLRWMEL